ncbi:hypothetical protein, partial [Brasilonema sp. UFV-L1]|uniref:hypothetical protein n=1 Tax=Brasilonema sp. UFV-L1 TaxID=2234130 RepID=UPI001B7D18AE
APLGETRACATTEGTSKGALAQRTGASSRETRPQHCPPQDRTGSSVGAGEFPTSPSPHSLRS